MKKYSDVVIVGAGASGLLCGGLLAMRGVNVTILEKNPRVGKKLSATGNGRCNFTNLDMDTGHYYGDGDWLSKLLSRFTPEKVIRQFETIGVCHREKDGYVYPHTNQAITVVEALQTFCRKHHVEIVTECKVSAILSAGVQEGYRIRTPEGEIRSRYVVLATGGKAGSEQGGDGNGYKLARSLGHRIHSIYPGLTGLVCEGEWWKQAAGTRIQGRFSLQVENRRIEGESGEIQIVKDGVSGIPVFQLCRVAAQALSEGKYVEGIIDFVPQMSRKEVQEWLAVFGPQGLIPKKWVPIMKNRAELAKCLKEFNFPIRQTFGIGRAQVTAGGVPTEEVRAETMESRIVPGVFLTGEILDIDGKCGGYNLHFAWACANAAAEEIMNRIKGNE